MATVGAARCRCRTAVPSAKLGVQTGHAFPRLPLHRSSRTQRIQQWVPVVKAQKSSFDASEKIDEFTSYLEKQWDQTEQKPVAVALIIAGLVALYAVNGIVGNVEKIPIFGFLFELVGILVSGWFGYRYLVFESDREELKQNIDDFIDKVRGA